MATATVYETTAPSSKRMAKNSSLFTAQKSFLSSKGFDYDKLFSVPCADFGLDLLVPMRESLKVIADKVAAVHVQAGFPIEREEELAAHVLKSFTHTAGLQEATKAIGIATYEKEMGEELPADFFGKASTRSPGVQAERKTMDVSTQF